MSLPRLTLGATSVPSTISTIPALANQQGTLPSWCGKILLLSGADVFRVMAKMVRLVGTKILTASYRDRHNPTIVWCS